jgi:Rha family phage regulatory protein
VSYRNGKLTDSRALARVFSQRHGYVLEHIRAECRTLERLGYPGLAKIWFRKSHYVDFWGRSKPAYEISGAGLMMLTLTMRTRYYRGRRANLVKAAFVQKFNAMEHRLGRRKG